MKNETFVNVYRTGGTENFKWIPVIPIQGRDAANTQREEIERMGYRCYTYTLHQLEVIGVPDTYEYTEQ